MRKALRSAALLGSLGLVAVIAACGGGEGRVRLALGQEIVIDAADLPGLLGETPLVGDLALTFERVATADSYNDDICGYGLVTAKGKFVAVAYRVRNDAQARMQPSSQLADEFVLVDGRGRQWREAEYQYSGYCFINANFAEQFGGEGPEHWIGPGFEGRTAVVFDVPTDAQNLSLRHERLGFSVDLEGPAAPARERPSQPTGVGCGISARRADQVPELPQGLIALSAWYKLSVPAAAEGQGCRFITISLDGPTQDPSNVAFWTYRDGAWVRLAGATLANDGAAAEAELTEIPANLAVLRDSR